MAPNFDNQTKRMPLKLEDFEILDPIGTGSFSNVYHAIHKNSGRHVALKKIFWNISPDRIVSEVKFMKTLNRTDNHENIVKILGLFRDFDQSTVVMDYIPHVPFRTFLPTVTGLQIKQYMFGMIEALCFVHSHKIIHRDVKPANFLFNPATGKGCL